MQTFSDQVQQLRDSFREDKASGRVGRQARAAVRKAYVDLGNRRLWNYLLKRTQLNLIGPFNTGTVQFTNATGQLVLTGGTWPSWAGTGQILINRNVYQVQSMLNSTTLILQPGRMPATDLSAGTAYQLVQTVYPLPTDFAKLRKIVEIERIWTLGYLSPEDMLQRTQVWFNPSEILWYSILGGSNGQMVTQWSPAPASNRTVDVLYQARPRPFSLSAPYAAGTAVTTAGSATVTFTGSNLPTNIAGCVLRIGTSSLPPDGITGDNPYVEEHVIQQWNSATQLTLQDTAVFSGTGLMYTIDDPIDVFGVAMQAYYDRMCERVLNQLMQTDVRRIADSLANEDKAFVQAMAADNAVTPPGLVGGGIRNLWDTTWGMHVSSSQ